VAEPGLGLLGKPLIVGLLDLYDDISIQPSCDQIKLLTLLSLLIEGVEKADLIEGSATDYLLRSSYLLTSWGMLFFSCIPVVDLVIYIMLLN